MKLPVETKPAIMGAIAGAIAVAVIGFSWGGWLTANTAAANSKQASSKAVVAALAPICADNFRRASDSAGQLVELKKVSPWLQAGFVEKAGWAKMPGAASIESGMAGACAELILATKP
jgi:pimeloyl-ACP methyl ester carboxylesterase